MPILQTVFRITRQCLFLTGLLVLFGTAPGKAASAEFGRCLSEKGATFYGASWCPHCQEQKRIFGASAERLPYVECSLAGPSGPQSMACRQAGIRSYPTWTINGRVIIGQVMSLADLADASGFPGGAASFRLVLPPR